MADNREDRSRNSQPNSRNIYDRRSGHRHHEEDPPYVRPSQPLTPQAQLMSVPHPGVQSHPRMEVDITERSDQTIQAHGNGAGDTDQQLATGSSVNVVDNKGPTQLGERSTVIYNITNNNYYSPQPPHHHSNSSYHDPTHCEQCLVYHHKDHPPLREHLDPNPASQHSGQSHPFPQLLPSTEQAESSAQGGNVKSRTDTRNPAHESQTATQRSSTSGHSVQASDVTRNVTHVKKRAKKVVKPAVASNEVPKSQTSQEVSRSAETRQVPEDEVPDNVTIIDSRGSRLMPGDAVWLSASGTFAVYIGNQEVVYCDRRDSKVVKRQRLELTEPFRKCRVVRGDVRASPRGEVIRRAESRVGTEFTEGEWCDGLDFHVWAMTGLGGRQAGRRGFGLGLY